jgi:Cu2+-containing amine oxidase
MLTKILVVYSTVTTTLLAAFTLASGAAARGQDKVQQVDELDVHRINVRERDGTLRMVISNHERLPGVVVRGKEFRSSTRTAKSSVNLDQTSPDELASPLPA